MRRSGLFAVLIVSGFLFLSGCVEKVEYDALQKKFNDTTKELSEAKDSLRKSQDELTELRAHWYRTYASGGRTWRLDSADGSTCILLTNSEDWKKSETKGQSCPCEDLYRDSDISGMSDRAFEICQKRSASLCGFE
jgi:hypothetical protein